MAIIKHAVCPSVEKLKSRWYRCVTASCLHSAAGDDNVCPKCGGAVESFDQPLEAVSSLPMVKEAVSAATDPANPPPAADKSV